MPQSPFAPAENTPKRWQFSLWGLMLFMLSVAVGASVVEVKHLGMVRQAEREAAEKKPYKESFAPPQSPQVDRDWNSGLTAVFVFWIILGLYHQTCDLRQFLASQPSIGRQERAGLRFEVLWRAAIIALLLLYTIIEFLFFWDIVALPDNDEFIPLLFGGGRVLREAVFVLVLLLVVASVPHVARRPRWRRLGRIIEIVACACAAGLCLYRWSDITYTHHLVRFAVNGIDIATSLRHCAINAHDYPRDCALFFYWSLASVVLVIVDWILLQRLAANWSPGEIRRWIWLSLFSLGIAGIGSFVAWVYLRGLRHVAPAFADGGFSVPHHCWIAIGLLLAILTTASAYRLTIERNAIAYGPLMSWRTNRGKYYHEWRTFLVGLAATDIAFRMYEVVLATLQPQIPGGIKRFSFLGNVGAVYVWMPEGCLWLALVVLALSRAFVRRIDLENPQSDVPRLCIGKFATIWLATAVFLVLASLTLVWMSFGLWLNPWFGGR